MLKLYYCLLAKCMYLFSLRATLGISETCIQLYILCNTHGTWRSCSGIERSMRLCVWSRKADQQCAVQWAHLASVCAAAALRCLQHGHFSQPSALLLSAYTQHYKAQHSWLCSYGTHIINVGVKLCLGTTPWRKPLFPHATQEKWVFPKVMSSSPAIFEIDGLTLEYFVTRGKRYITIWVNK